MQRAPRKRGGQIRSHDARQYLLDASEVASDIVERCRAVLATGLLDREQLENFKVAATVLLKMKELQLEGRKIALNPGVKTLVINNTARQLASIPDAELKELASAMLAAENAPK